MRGTIINETFFRVAIGTCLIFVMATIPGDLAAAGAGHRHGSAKLAIKVADVTKVTAIATALGLRARPAVGTKINRGRKRRYTRPFLPFGKGRMFKATVGDPKKLAQWGVKGLRRGDTVKVIGMKDGRIAVLPLRPKVRPTALKVSGNVLTSCGCFEHESQLRNLLVRRLRKGRLVPR